MNGYYNDLHRAYLRASNVYNRLSIPGISAEEKVLKDVTSMVMEAIECMDKNTNLQSLAFEKLRNNTPGYSASNILQLGSALSVLLEQMLSDRIEVFAQQMQQVQQPPPPARQPPPPLQLFHSSPPPPRPVVPTATMIKREDIKEEPLEDEEDPTSSGTLQATIEPLYNDLEEHAIKEELEDVKVEPTEVVAKEEPLADVFCPSSESIRSKESPRINAYRLSSINSRSVEVPRLTNSQLVDPKFGFLNELKRLEVKEAVRQELSKKITIESVQKCHLCEKVTNTFTGIPAEPHRRDVFLAKIVPTTKIEAAKLRALKWNNERHYFCVGHVQYPHKLHVTPDNDRLKEVLALPTNFKPTFTRERIAEIHKINGDTLTQPPPQPVANPRKKIEPISIKCCLCGEPSFPNRVSPADPVEARKFFDNLVNVTDQNRDRFQFYLDNNMRVDVCPKHIKRRCVEQDQRKGPNHQCALCGCIANPCILTPKNRMEAQQFFEHLVEATSPQLLQLKSLIEQNIQSTICAKHYKPPLVDKPQFQHRRKPPPNWLKVVENRVIEVEEPEVVVASSSKRKTTFQSTSDAPASKKKAIQRKEDSDDEEEEKIHQRILFGQGRTQL